jgi:hypothetical protein
MRKFIICNLHHISCYTTVVWRRRLRYEKSMLRLGREIRNSYKIVFVKLGENRRPERPKCTFKNNIEMCGKEI